MYLREIKASRTLEIRDLHIVFRTATGLTEAVRGISLSVRKGRITALVGESGSGKSVTAMSVMNLLSWNGRISAGKIFLGSTDVLQLKASERRRLNGSVFGMIFQDPTASLDPLFTIGDQMTEGIMRHRHISRKEAEEISRRQLSAMHMQDVDYLMGRRPFELSGGMCQRVMIAMVMALEPDFLIADEPTTALDVTVQEQILRQIRSLCLEKDIGVLFITHDLGVVAEIADDVYIMKDGRIEENGSVFDIFDHPAQPYTKRLMASIL